jgi:hypothetical protein
MDEPLKTIFYLFFTIIIAFIFKDIMGTSIYNATVTGNWNKITWSPDGNTGDMGDIIITNSVTITIDLNFTLNNLTVGRIFQVCYNSVILLNRQW